MAYSHRTFNCKPTKEVRMRGDAVETDAVFSYVSPAQRVPQDHPLRIVREITDAALERLSRDFEGLYSKVGRPSVPPERPSCLPSAPWSVGYSPWAGASHRLQGSRGPPCSRCTHPTPTIRPCTPRARRGRRVSD